ncbi:hypothetical protein P4O66_015379 [Electrophorus voltai]|uniref:Uncharacterized protein n=1 Tax=Electrophorus voltai TaxID=2609070 RepID=A0AAD8YY40_9TELE|nr:hypothetical protein P4O66_015379 [Electrophorus voltai]
MDYYEGYRDSGEMEEHSDISLRSDFESDREEDPSMEVEEVLHRDAPSYRDTVDSESDEPPAPKAPPRACQSSASKLPQVTGKEALLSSEEDTPPPKANSPRAHVPTPKPRRSKRGSGTRKGQNSWCASRHACAKARTAAATQAGEGQSTPGWVTQPVSVVIPQATCPGPVPSMRGIARPGPVPGVRDAAHLGPVPGVCSCSRASGPTGAVPLDPPPPPLIAAAMPPDLPPLIVAALPLDPPELSPLIVAAAPLGPPVPVPVVEETTPSVPVPCARPVPMPYARPVPLVAPRSSPVFSTASDLEFPLILPWPVSPVSHMPPVSPLLPAPTPPVFLPSVPASAVPVAPVPLVLVSTPGSCPIQSYPVAPVSVYAPMSADISVIGKTNNHYSAILPFQKEQIAKSLN